MPRTCECRPFLPRTSMRAPQVKELFNPDYGMFTYDEAVRLHWFRPSSLSMETEFELVGVLIGEFANLV